MLLNEENITLKLGKFVYFGLVATLLQKLHNCIYIDVKIHNVALDLLFSLFAALGDVRNFVKGLY